MKFFLPLFLFLGAPCLGASKTCTQNLLAAGSNTQTFLNYLGQLLEQNLIGSDELSFLSSSIKASGEVKNPISDKKALVNSALYIHQQALNAFQDGTLLKNQVLEWAENILAQYSRNETERLETQKDTQNANTQMHFHPLNFGPTDIEVMATLVTQKMWLNVMGENPAFFKDSPNHLENPVESITFWSALEFANRLSISHGLEPVYDFKNANFRDGSRAENGTLFLLYHSVVPIKKDANGYRLPLVSERAFLISDLGRHGGRHFPGVDDNNIGDFAWTSNNSGGQTHPVGEKQPLVIDGNEFFDIYGNVEQFAINDFDHQAGVLKPAYVTAAGGSFASDPWWTVNTLSKTDIESHEMSSDIGFRLVRTLPTGK